MFYLITLLIILIGLAFLLDEFSGIYIVCIMSMVTIIIMIVVGGVVYFNSIGKVAEMEAFQENTLAVYEYVIDESENITINAVKEAEGSMMLDTGNLAYFELAKSVNSNLIVLRESIRVYNTRLYTYRKYNANWLTDSFICDVPEYLKPIKMQ